MKNLTLLFIAGFALTATAHANNEKTYTVKEFEADLKLQKVSIEKCKNGELHPEDLNCLNARTARRHNKNLNLE